MVRLCALLLIAIRTSLAMDPFFDHSKEKRDQETQTENNEEQVRRISHAEDLSSLVQRNYSSIASSQEIDSSEKTSLDPIMNVSASHASAAPLITLEQCQQAVSEHPKACNLIIQHDASGASSTVLPATFYDHFISAIFPTFKGKENTPPQERSRQMTRELLGLLQEQYGEKIAAASFPSVQHRIAIAHPLNTKDLGEILTTAEVLLKQKDAFFALEVNPQFQTLAQEVQIAEAKVDQTARATQKKLSAIEKKHTFAVHGSSALRLGALEKAEHAAHQEAIAAKDRFAITLRKTFQTDEGPDLSSDTYLSEGTPLLSQKSNGKNYRSISQIPN